MELKKAELAKLREEYIAQKAREKVCGQLTLFPILSLLQVVAFDLGAQNRKLVDVQVRMQWRLQNDTDQTVSVCWKDEEAACASTL
jgi:hypothetical protein